MITPLERFSRLVRCLYALAAVIAVACAAAGGSPSSAKAAGNGITIIDGDTLEVDGEVVGLLGIDAPELGQTCLNGDKRWRCGLEAALALKGLVDLWGGMFCKRSDEVSDKPKAVCQSKHGQDLAETLVVRGYAVALHESNTFYARAEAVAKDGKLGIWRGEFVLPAEWRNGVRLPGGSADGREACDVKGTMTADGNRVFYVPTDKEYDRIRIDPEKGERYFCSDDAAVLAGWKRYPRPISK